MKVIVQVESGRIVFNMEPDELDAVPPVSSVFIQHSLVGRVDEARIALMAYLLAVDFTSNTLELIGASWPSYLAAGVQAHQPGHEFFPFPITNTPKKIAPAAFHYDCARVPATAADGPGLSMIRSELGYELSVPGTDGKERVTVLKVSTNVDLLSAFTSHFEFLSEVFVYLGILDGLGVRELRMEGREEGAPWLGISNLVAVVGGSLVWEGELQ